MKATDWEELTEESFKKVFANSPLQRTKYSGIQRNLKLLRDTQDTVVDRSTTQWADSRCALSSCNFFSNILPYLVSTNRLANFSQGYQSKEKSIYHCNVEVSERPSINCQPVSIWIAAALFPIAWNVLSEIDCDIGKKLPSKTWFNVVDSPRIIRACLIETCKSMALEIRTCEGNASDTSKISSAKISSRKRVVQLWPQNEAASYRGIR